MTHTPGPWIAGEMGTSEADTTICYVRSEAAGPEAAMLGGPDICLSQGWGNANLIAAAPDLLAACEEFVRKVDAGEARSSRSYAQMVNAIRKARGDTIKECPKCGRETFFCADCGMEGEPVPTE